MGKGGLRYDNSYWCGSVAKNTVLTHSVSSFSTASLLYNLLIPSTTLSVLLHRQFPTVDLTILMVHSVDSVIE